MPDVDGIDLDELRKLTPLMRNDSVVFEFFDGLGVFFEKV